MARQMFLKVIIFFSFLLLSSTSTNAAILYIDPGTGSLIFQIISAIVLAILFYFSLIKKTIVKLFDRIKKIFLNEKTDTR